MIAVVLAAGKGVRMKSARPKVLHELCGRPMVRWVVDAARGAGAKRVIVVVSPDGDAVRAALPDCAFALQKEPRGTGDALRSALPLIRGAREPVLVLYGDTPCLMSGTLRRLRRAYGRGPLALITLRPPGASAYGRIVRDGAGRIARIVERKNATPKERAIREMNAGMYLADARFLARALPRLRPSPRTREVYLTDIVAAAARSARVVATEGDPVEVAGVNDRADLALAQRVLQWRILHAHRDAGVAFVDPPSVRVDPGVSVGVDSEIGAGVELRGKTVVGAGVRIGRGCVVTDSRIGDGAALLPYCVIEESVVGRGARVGPFAHLRPGTDLGPGVHVGNFVETKKARLGAGSKANHLSYLGDAEIGEKVNVGAGTITCNYDGIAKHTTVIEDGAFIGSDTQLVAPVRVGRDAYVGAGATITRNVPAGALAITRVPQKHVEGFAARRAARAAKPR